MNMNMNMNKIPKQFKLKKYNKFLRKQANTQIGLIFGDKKSSDFKIYCGKDQVMIPCHKLILEARSKYFMIIKKENQTNTIHFNNFSSEIVKPIIKFFYNGKFKFDKQKFDEYFNFAKKIKSREIQTKIELEIESILNVENIVEIYFKTQKINSQNLYQICQQFISENFESIISNPNFKTKLNQNQINDFIVLIDSNHEIKNNKKIIQLIQSKKEDDEKFFPKDFLSMEKIEQQKEKEFFTSFPNGEELFKIWQEIISTSYIEIDEKIVEFCLLFQDSFQKWNPFQTKANPNENGAQSEKYFDLQEIDEGISKKEAHSIKFILFMISLFTYSKDLIKQMIQKENQNQNKKENIQGHKYLISLSIIAILSKSKFNRQNLCQNRIFQIIQDLLEITKHLFKLMENFRKKKKKSNLSLSIYYLMEIQFILLGIMEILNQYFRERQLLPNQEIIESFKQTSIIPLLIDCFEFNLKLRKVYFFTTKQMGIVLKLLEMFENFYRLNLLKEKEKIDLVLLLLPFFQPPNLSSTLPNIGFEIKEGNENEKENRIEIEDVFETNYFMFDPKIKKRENPFILQNFRTLKPNLVLLEFDFRSNIFQFLTQVIEEENISDQIINNNRISYIGDFILWISYYLKPKLSKKWTDLKKEIEEKKLHEKETGEMQTQTEKEVQITNPKKVSEIRLYNNYFDTVFNHIRDFQFIEKSSQNTSLQENLQKELDKYSNETQNKVHNFKERLIVIFLDLFKNPENKETETETETNPYLIHILSNEKIIKIQKFIKKFYPQLQMYILIELKKMIITGNDQETLKFFQENGGWEIFFSDYFIRRNLINLDIEEREKIHLDEMNTDLQTLLIDFMFNVLLKYQNHFDYGFLFDQISKNTNIRSNLFLLNRFLEMIIELIKTNPQVSSNKIIEIAGFREIQEILSHSIKERHNQTIALCLDILDLSFQNADIEVIFGNEDTINVLMKLFENKLNQKIPFVYVPKILENAKNGENENQLIFYLIQKILFLCQKISSNQNNQEKNNAIELHVVEEFFAKCSESISRNREVIQNIFLNPNLFFIFQSLLNDKEQNTTYLILSLLQEIIRNNQTLIDELYQIIPIPEFITILYETEKGKPTKKLFQILLDLMIDNGTFSIENNFIIRNENMINVILELYSYNLKQTQNENQEISFSEVLGIFNTLCEKSLHNIYCCCRQRITPLLLELIPQIQNLNLFNQNIQFIGTLGAHQILVSEMKQYFCVLKDQLRNTKRNKFSMAMLVGLRKIINQNSEQNETTPKNFFDFYEENSNITLPTFKNNFISKKFSFITWIRFEDFHIKNPHSLQENEEKDYRTKIFSFLTEDSQGIQLFAEFSNKNEKLESLIYQISSNQEKEIIEKRFHFQIEFKKWFLFVFTQKYKKSNSQCEISISLDENQTITKKIMLPRKIGNQKSFIRNEIGSNFSFSDNQKSPNPKSFFGQMGTIYLFQEFLNHKKAKAIHFLGPNYNSFFYESEFFKYSNPAIEKELKEIFNGKLTQKITNYYNPKEMKENLFLNHSPMTIIKENSQSHKIYSFSKTNFQDIASCLGGVEIFFYLIFEIDELFEEENFEMNNVIANPTETETQAKVFFEELLKIMQDILLNDSNLQKEMIQKDGFSILNNILKSINSKYFSKQLYHLIKNLQEKIQNDEFQIQLKNQLIFDFHIWKNFSFEIQKKIISKNENENQNITIFDLLVILYYYDESLNKIQQSNSPPQNEDDPKKKIEESSQNLFSMIEILLDKIENYESTTKYLQSLISTCFLFQTKDFVEKMLKFLFEFLSKMKKQNKTQLFTVKLYEPLIQLMKENKMNTKLICFGLEIIHLIDASLNINEEKNQILANTREFEMSKLEHFYPLIHKILANSINKIPKQVVDILFKMIYGNGNDRSKPSIIQNPFILATITEIVDCFPDLVDIIHFHKLFYLIAENDSNKEKMLSKFGWQKWFASLLNFTQADQEEKNEDENRKRQNQHDVNEIIFSTLNLLFIYSFYNTSYNFPKMFEQFLSSVYLVHFSAANKQTIPNIIERIISDIIEDLNINLKVEIDINNQSSFTSTILLTSNSSISKEHFSKNLFYLINVLNGMVFNLSKNQFEFTKTEKKQQIQIIQTKVSKHFTAPLKSKKSIQNMNLPPQEQNLKNIFEVKFDSVKKGKILKNLLLILDKIEFFKEKTIQFKSKDEQRIIFKIIIFLIIASIPQSDIKLSNFLLSKLNQMISEQLNFKSSSIQNAQELISICFSFFFSCIQNEDHISDENENHHKAKRNLLLTYLQMIMQENYNFLFGLFSIQNKKQKLLSRKPKNSFVFSSKNIQEFEKELMKDQWKSAANRVFFPINEKISRDIQENEKEFIKIQSSNTFHMEELFNKEFQVKQKEIELISKKIEAIYKNFKTMIDNSIIGKYPWSVNEISVLDKEFSKQQYYAKLSGIEDEMRRQKKLKFYSKNQNQHQNQNQNEKRRNLIKVNQRFHSKIIEISDQLTQSESENENLNLNEKEKEKEKDKKRERFKRLVILFSKQCEMISKTKITKGKLQITENSINFFVNFDLKKEEKVKDYLWKIETIKLIHKRRYLFKHSALEIFFENNRKYVFLNFQTMEDRNEIYERIQKHRLANIDLSSFNYFGNDPTKWIEKTQMTKKWQERKISNFEYIMYLNTISGRTYHDISQYPIFPWIISDYESEKIDLNNIDVFRDLSKPIGMQYNKIMYYYENYEINGKQVEFEFNYQKYYSNPEIVTSYLARLEPFTSICLKEKYPIFKSIPETWQQIKEQNSLDFNGELIPEFFHLPDFLRKPNIFQQNENENEKLILNKIEDVELPKWAKTPEEFIRIQKEALEAEYVSENLDYWIDLIFGYKQKGKESKNVLNVFHPSLYEENIDFSKLEQMQKEIQRKGQIPIQLFTQKHPKRLKTKELQQKIVSFFGWKNILSSSKFIHLTKLGMHSNPVIFTIFQESGDALMILGSSDKIVTIDKEGIIQKHTFSLFDSNSKNQGFNCALEKKLKEKIELSFSKNFNNFQESIGIDTNSNCIICCGFSDNTFKFFQFDGSKMVQSISKHKDTVNCISNDSKYIVTGSRDTTVIVWEFDLKEGKVKEIPKHVFEHEKEVKSVAISTEYDIVLSGSIDGKLIFHSLNKGKHIQSIILSDQKPISIIQITKEGNIITFSENSNILRLFTINGYLLKEAKCLQNVYSISITQDSNFIFLGGENGIFEIRNLFDLNLIQKVGLEAKIYSISIIEKSFLIIFGLGNGETKIGEFILK
ncbi:beige/beach-related [Anaeramoeba ignava]|uniref:Beige/beach-related n=1 Tax=Anaeramoeba ignava TaxID=1746090 RepID=A0A9Q0R574_ANAIG|nr:beige/beach-related [Anaeramoeba ignava]